MYFRIGFSGLRKCFAKGTTEALKNTDLRKKY
jgi:hypothetical protein